MKTLKNWKTIYDFDDLLHYVNRLGYAGNRNNPIVYKQQSLVQTCDIILNSSGQSVYYNMKQFKVKHNRENNCFLVENIVTHKIMVCYPYKNKIVEYIPINSLCSGWNKPVNDPYHTCVVCDRN